MPRVKSINEFNKIMINGHPSNFLRWKWVAPDYSSDRKFVLVEDSGFSEAKINDLREHMVSHLLAHVEGTCNCEQPVEQDAPDEKRTMLICEEVL